MLTRVLFPFGRVEQAPWQHGKHLTHEFSGDHEGRKRQRSLDDRDRQHDRKANRDVDPLGRHRKINDRNGRRLQHVLDREHARKLRKLSHPLGRMFVVGERNSIAFDGGEPVRDAPKLTNL